MRIKRTKRVGRACVLCRGVPVLGILARVSETESEKRLESCGKPLAVATLFTIIRPVDAKQSEDV